MIAHLNAEDQGDGTIRMQAMYIGGYNEKSPAHQAIRQAMAYLDSLMTRLEEPTETKHHANGEVEVIAPGSPESSLLPEQNPALDVTMNLPEGALPVEGRA